MNGLELIRHRRSVRTFDGNPLRLEDREKLLRFAESIETPYGIPIAWKLLSAKADGLSSPVIVGTDAYIAGKLRRQPHAEIHAHQAKAKYLCQQQAQDDADHHAVEHMAEHGEGGEAHRRGDRHIDEEERFKYILSASL